MRDMKSTLIKALAGTAALAFVLIVAAVLLIPRAWQGTPEPEFATVLFDQMRPLPNVTFTDHRGERFVTSRMEDQFTLLFFGFTHCPDVCPLTLQVLSDVQNVLSATRPAESPDILFVSVDPVRDTPQRMAEYLEFFDAEITGVTADDREMEPLLQALGVHVHRETQQGQNYNVIHNPTVYVVGPRAELIAVFGAAERATLIASDYLRIRERYLHRFPELRTRVGVASR